jgi:hypothetical protein
MNKEIINQLAENLDSKIKLRGILEMIDGVIIKFGIEQGVKYLESKGLDDEFYDLAEGYLSADANKMVDEAADMLAEIVKIVFIGEPSEMLEQMKASGELEKIKTL